MAKKKLKVAVAMSGGVDSSVSAALLKEKGYDVSGFFMKFWSDPSCKTTRENSCCASESLKRARKVASKLSIPFHIIDIRKAFKKIVVDDFMEGYKNITTPNPCVQCNKFIKFGWFLRFALAFGFDKIATGHYAQIKKDKRGIYHLLSGRDKTKDQSYFLYQLNQDQLSKIIFPVGNLAKKEVWKIAKAKKLEFEDKKESQEICFVQDNDYRNFLKRHLPRKYFKPGNIVNVNGKIIGKHEGLLNYTMGQRKGIQQTIRNENRKPLYVIGFSKSKNELLVGANKNTYSRKLELGNIAWISQLVGEEALKNNNLKAKIRYRHIPAPCVVKAGKNKTTVIFNKPQRAITPGQHAVFYRKNEVLGGGIIYNL